MVQVAERVYLDNAAMAMPRPIDRREDAERQRLVFGNPGSVHPAGLEARRQQQAARSELADTLGLPKKTIYFCSGATEAANLLIQGIARHELMMGMRRRRILVSEVEHPCVFKAAQFLKSQGFDFRAIQVDKDGLLDRDQLDRALEPGTVSLVAVMTVNNEIGTLQPIPAIARQVKERDEGIFFLSDAVQAIGKVPFTLCKEVDGFFFCGHKLDGATRGGAFYRNSSFRIEPLFYGGDQEDGLRPGTEDPNTAIRLVQTVRARVDALTANAAHVTSLRDEFFQRLDHENVPFRATVNPALTSPYIASIILNGLSAREAFDFLVARGICVSRGSACASRSAKESRILEAINCPSPDSVLRVSFAPENTIDDVSALAVALGEYVKDIR